ncbi:MAG TPA: hypothetical protein VFY28_01010, partial [Candidatus Paceibacterota bacterium]|nr:hypothetical protein [Candidatus Paceibacterota bacterium]
LTPAFNYGETYGYFYYRYYDYRNMDYRSQGGTYGKNYGGEGCYGNNIPLYKIRDNVTSDPNYNPVNPRGLYVGDVESSPFMLDVPAMSVPFTFTVEPTGTPPTAPIIDGPTIGEPSTSYTFSFLSTDPDGDTLHYRIDWDNNGTVTQMLPPSGDVPSGTEKETANQANQWTTEGAKTFKAQAVDSRGATSEWSSHTITLAEPPPVLTCSVSPASIQAGEDAQWSASPSNLGTYTWTPSEGGSAGGSGATLNRTYPFPGNYSMTVSAGGQNANCPVLSVGGVCPAPNTVTLTASPNRVNEGDSTTLTLSGTGIATSCIVTGPGVSQTVAASACSLPTTTIPTGAITVQSTYTVSCDDGAVTDTAIVNLVPKFEEF